MIEKNDFFRVKRNLENNIGKKVRVTSKKGRKKSVVRQGIIERTYPSVFTVKIENENENEMIRRVSYSYTDLLTKTVELVVYGADESVKCS